MKIAMSLLIAGFLAGSPTATPSPVATAVPYTDPDAYEVYSALLPLDWTWTATNATRLVIDETTASHQMCIEPDSDSVDVLNPIIAEYAVLAKTRWLLQPQLKLSRPIDLVSHEELASFFLPQGGGWGAFKERYPASGHSFISLSAVAFNQERTVAIVYMDHHCGFRCGGGQFYVLQKRESKWTNTSWSGLSCGWAS